MATSVFARLGTFAQHKVTRASCSDGTPQWRGQVCHCAGDHLHLGLNPKQVLAAQVRTFRNGQLPAEVWLSLRKATPSHRFPGQALESIGSPVVHERAAESETLLNGVYMKCTHV